MLVWLLWQLKRAKQFTNFKRWIKNELKPQVIEAITKNLLATQSELTPNNQCHVQATITYWCEYPVRIVQFALANELISTQWLKDTDNYRHCQHLYHIEGKYLHHYLDEETPNNN